MDKKTEKLFYKELKIPCHINYIAERVLKTSKESANMIIQELLMQNIVTESEFAKNYFKLKNHA